MKPLMFVILVLSLMLTLVVLEFVVQKIFSVVPQYYSLYSKETISLIFWLVPIFSTIVWFYPLFYDISISTKGSRLLHGRRSVVKDIFKKISLQYIIIRGALQMFGTIKKIYLLIVDDDELVPAYLLGEDIYLKKGFFGVDPSSKLPFKYKDFLFKAKRVKDNWGDSAGVPVIVATKDSQGQIIPVSNRNFSEALSKFMKAKFFKEIWSAGSISELLLLHMELDDIRRLERLAMAKEAG